VLGVMSGVWLLCFATAKHDTTLSAGVAIGRGFSDNTMP
jgi:hypothetical protein